MSEVSEAVRERIRMAEAWSKSTGYPPADYFDSMMDLRRMMKQFDELRREIKETRALAFEEAAKMADAFWVNMPGQSRGKALGDALRARAAEIRKEAA